MTLETNRRARTSLNIPDPGIPAPAGRTSVRTVAAASLPGNAIEYYDFSIYGLAAALVFFPDATPFIATLAAFGTLAVGFVARPLGAVIFGHFGDRIGRKPMLVVTLLLMGIATMAIGLLPGYAQIGVWAPIALVALRVLQGIAFGGEWGGAILMAFEYAPRERRGFFAAIPQVGPATGSLLGNAVFLAVAFLPDKQLFSWGWRVPFLVSFLLVVIGMLIRLKIEESPDFQVTKTAGREVKVPIATVLRHHLRAVLLVAGGFLGFGAFSIMILVYLVNYGTNGVGIDSSVMLTATLISMAIQIPAILFAGHLSDRGNRRLQMTVGTALAIVSIFVLFLAVDSGNPAFVLVAYAVGAGLLYPIAYGAQPALFAEAFPTEIRFTGMSLGYQVSNVLGSGFGPMIAAALLQGTGTIWSVPIFVGVTLLVSLVCLAKLVGVADARRKEDELAA